MDRGLGVCGVSCCVVGLDIVVCVGVGFEQVLKVVVLGVELFCFECYCVFVGGGVVQVCGDCFGFLC